MGTELYDVDKKPGKIRKKKRPVMKTSLFKVFNMPNLEESRWVPSTHHHGEAKVQAPLL
jgi:hypothetical protein